MKKTQSILLAFLFALCLSPTALAAEDYNQTQRQTITEETTEAGATRITVDNGDGRVFTIEELPEYGIEDFTVIETPTSESTLKEEYSAEPADAVFGESDSEQQEAQAVHPPVWLCVLLGAGAAAAVLIWMFRRRK